MVGSVKRFIVVFILSIFSIGAYAQNTKVVVIPMFEENPPLEPFAPLTSPSPSLDNYTVTSKSVIDKITGLEWQKETDSFYDPNWNWIAAREHCALLDLNNKTDWRLPSVSALMSIVYYGSLPGSQPTINIFAFPSTYKEKYWTSNWKADPYGDVWTINFKSGHIKAIGYQGLGEQVYARCVRSTITQGSVLRDNGDHTVSDLATGLLWQKTRSVVARSWTTAQEYCSNLELGNFSDWRLPNVKELASIIDYRVDDPAIDTLMAAGTSSQKPFWSDTSKADEATTKAFAVNFESGSISSESKTATDGYARCVR